MRAARVTFPAPSVAVSVTVWVPAAKACSTAPPRAVAPSPKSHASAAPDQRSAAAAVVRAGAPASAVAGTANAVIAGPAASKAAAWATLVPDAGCAPAVQPARALPSPSMATRGAKAPVPAGGDRDDVGERAAGPPVREQRALRGERGPGDHRRRAGGAGGKVEVGVLGSRAA